MSQGDSSNEHSFCLQGAYNPLHNTDYSLGLHGLWDIEELASDS